MVGSNPGCSIRGKKALTVRRQGVVRVIRGSRVTYWSISITVGREMLQKGTLIYIVTLYSLRSTWSSLNSMKILMIALWLWTADWRIWIKKVVNIISHALSFSDCAGSTRCPINQSAWRKLYEIQAIIVLVVEAVSVVSRTAAIASHYIKCILLVINTRFVQIMIVLARWFEVCRLFNIWIWTTGDRFLNSKSICDLVLSLLAPWPWLRFVGSTHEPRHHCSPISLREELRRVSSLPLRNIAYKILRDCSLVLNFRMLSLLEWRRFIDSMDVDVNKRLGGGWRILIIVAQ